MEFKLETALDEIFEGTDEEQEVKFVDVGFGKEASRLLILFVTWMKITFPSSEGAISTP